MPEVKSEATNPKPLKWCDVVLGAVYAQGKYQHHVAAWVGETPQNFSKWFPKNKFKPKWLPIIWEKLHRQILERYPQHQGNSPLNNTAAISKAGFIIICPDDTPPEEIAAPLPPTADTLIKEITALREDAIARAHTKEIERKSLALLGNLGERHFFISTTTAIPNHLWLADEDLEERKNENIDLLLGRIQGIKAGALFLMLVPNKTCFEEIRDHIHEKPMLAKHQSITAGYHRFRKRALKMLCEEQGNPRSAEEAVALFDSQQQLLEIDQFPFTGAGWTVNLLGQRDTGARLLNYAFIYGPYTNGLSLQLWHEQGAYLPEWLWHWMRIIVYKEAEKDMSADPPRAQFYKALKRRIRPRGEESPEGTEPSSPNPPPSN